MRRIIFSSLLLLTLFLFLPRVIQAQEKRQATTSEATEAIPVWSYADLEKNILGTNSDTTFVINFWATWCKPCVEELPEFERLTKEMKGKKVCVVLLSLDFRKDIIKKVLPFIRSHGIISQVALFSEQNQNEWISRISPEWSGAIPVTLVVNTAKGVREFYEKQCTFNELSTIVQRINGDNK